MTDEHICETSATIKINNIPTPPPKRFPVSLYSQFPPPPLSPDNHLSAFRTCKCVCSNQILCKNKLPYVPLFVWAHSLSIIIYFVAYICQLIVLYIYGYTTSFLFSCVTKDISIVSWFLALTNKASIFTYKPLLKYIDCFFLG